MPRLAAARAAPTVPETSVEVPRFWPKLTPETTTWGFWARPCWSTAQITVSAGKPATALAG